MVLRAQAPADTSPEEFVGGWWFDGKTFKQTTFFAVNGFLTATKPGGAVHTVDLKGGYVVPAFGDAHSHFPDSTNTLAWANPGFLDSGVFYILNPNDIAEQANPLRGRIANQSTVDVLFAHAGFTCPGGHPQPLYESLIDHKVYSYAKAELEGRAFYAVDTVADIERKWPQFLATQPDFVKLYLLHAERYGFKDASSRSDGLRPELVDELVRRAHTAGLRAGAHVESAADFHYALAGGVDWIMHLPGYLWSPSDSQDDYLIRGADVTLAHKHHVVVVTTIAIGEHRASNPDQQRLLTATQAENLRRLKGAGVTIVVGTDGGPGSVFTEIQDLQATGVFTNLELLRMLVETTPREIFPNRKIGRLATGYEANFLVLNGNPISDLSSLKSIALRVKQGKVVK